LILKKEKKDRKFCMCVFGVEVKKKKSNVMKFSFFDLGFSVLLSCFSPLCYTDTRHRTHA